MFIDTQGQRGTRNVLSPAIRSNSGSESPHVAHRPVTYMWEGLLLNSVPRDLRDTTDGFYSGVKLAVTVSS
jgi:hypothetical protein